MSQKLSAPFQAAKPLPQLKLDLKKGSLAGLHLGDSINQALAYIQLHMQVFGRVDIVASTKAPDQDKPLYLLLPDIGNSLQSLTYAC